MYLKSLIGLYFNRYILGIDLSNLLRGKDSSIPLKIILARN